MTNPKYPIYIISKGRWESRLTSKALEKMNVPYSIVVEPGEYDNYASVIDDSKIIKLPENFSERGQGSIPVRNWVWEDSIKKGFDRHWILDDNIRWFARLHKNKKTLINNGICFKVCEDIVDRYKNIAMAGLQYEMFTPTSSKINPFILNTRIYSCILLLNNIDFRWRGRYNEDTDLSLRILKARYCTFLLQVFVCKKHATLTMKGGNTDTIYNTDDKRLEFAKSLQRQHPDVAEVVWKFNRWHHKVNYRPFKNNKLILKDDIKIPKGINNYGMVLKNKIELEK